MSDTLFRIVHAFFLATLIFTQMTRKSKPCQIIGVTFLGAFVGMEIMWLIMQFV